VKLDPDYVRELLMEIEGHPASSMLLDGTFGYSRDEKMVHHVAIMIDDQLLAETGQSSYRLTATGHRFLAAIRDEGIWTKTKAAVAETGGNATLEILKKIANRLLEKQLEKYLGDEQ
jgi:hypothetical protein